MDSSQNEGTIAPTAAISAFPCTPEPSLTNLKHFYYSRGPKIWGAYGFRDAPNLGADSVSPSFLAIDQGPMVPMIEKYRSGLPWRMFMRSF